MKRKIRPGVKDVRLKSKNRPELVDKRVRERYEDLHQMHKNEREREILLEAWERFQDEE